ncbi:bifunctional adenosylcobinamide kinase/adenosylcobinamide-phosphate guanylyltransferase [Rheinheimera mesophila]|uniref:Bifunctional adenosylcobalamin biosynthesis protein n=1 Tax=Rheinheimera mesophila TaxID=1547515 RepID=A0A3P3QF57_9GAMM|nr:bifunctional adenosylcobinamide kinase/adenosylcobinamide-phosphate guanylyltransferase [Rheinheimera mesophila]KKL00714.1 adenosylcobinamide kinase [Rheinheimera mesophila]RRJ19776.1 bifunctional adenosylcobinamide kinase/adenosylcobinamide-phosphate guanylyltransferase [Rheinheimera mesophila]
MKKTLILGGARSGKSSLAEQLATPSEQICYIATATAFDVEMSQRIKLHQQQRPKHWQLVECPLILSETLTQLSASGQTVLVDCLTLWLNNQLYHSPDQDFALLRQQLADAVAQFEGQLILVSNEVGMGLVPLGELNRIFVDQQGWLNQQLARVCDEVIFVAAGLPLYLKRGTDAAD